MHDLTIINTIFNKYILSISLLIVASVLIAQNSNQVNPYYSKANISADVNYLIHKYHEIHPKPYLHVDSLTMKVFSDSLIASLPDSISIYQARQITGAISSKFSHGHSDISFTLPSDKNKKVYPFPFNTNIQNNKIIITKNLSDEPNVDSLSEIISINGVPTKQMFNTLRNSISLETEGAKNDYINEFFHIWLFFFYGFNGPGFDVSIKNTKGVNQSYTVHGEAYTVQVYIQLS